MNDKGEEKKKKDLSTLGIYKVNIPQKFVKPGILIVFGS